MEKIVNNMAIEIKEPPYPSSGDSIQTKWLMSHYGDSIGHILLENACYQIAKEFQAKPSQCKNIKFTLICEEIDGN